jgi:DNA-binding LacI/PurR family transcriptional regulator
MGKEFFNMAIRETKVVVAVPTFQSTILNAMGDHLKKLFKQGEMELRSVTGENNTQKDHLKKILAQIKPTALVAMDIQPDSDIITAYTIAGVPIILIDEEVAGVSTITTDNYLGGRIAGEYLVKIGRKKVAIVTGRTRVKGGYNAEQRLKGFQQALSSVRLSIPSKCMVEVTHYSRENGMEVMPKLLDAGVDGIFCAAGDNCAMGLIAVAKEKKVRIPEEIAIVGFDDLLIAQLSTPKLTTIKQPLEEMAKAAYQMAVLQRDEILRKPQNIKFNPEIVIRQSA